MANFHDPIDEQEILRQYMIRYIIHPVVCKAFGCGKHLTLEESRHGDHCLEHTGEQKIDIMKVVKFK